MRGGGGRRLLVITLALALSACQPPALAIPTPPETVEISLESTYDTSRLLHDLAAGFEAAHPELRLAWCLSTGDLETLTEAEHAPDEMPRYWITHYPPATTSLWVAPIAFDQIALITHPGNPISSLSSEQLRAIFEGRITHWSEIGGGEQPITVVSRESGSGTREAFEALALGGRTVTRSAILAPGSDAMRRIVQSTPGAIGYTTLGLAEANMRVLAIDGIQPSNQVRNAYPFVVPILIVGTQEPQDFFRSFIAWIQAPAGQAIVARRYLPLDD